METPNEPTPQPAAGTWGVREPVTGILYGRHDKDRAEQLARDWTLARWRNTRARSHPGQEPGEPDPEWLTTNAWTPVRRVA